MATKLLVFFARYVLRTEDSTWTGGSCPARHLPYDSAESGAGRCPYADVEQKS